MRLGGLSKGPPRRERLAPERDRVADRCSGPRAAEGEKENHQETAGLTEEGTPFQPTAYLPVGGAPGLGATSAASHGSGSPRRYC